MREWIIPVSHMHLSFIAVHVYLLGELLDDEEEVPDDKMEIISHASANVEAQDLEDEAVRIVARAGHNTRCKASPSVRLKTIHIQHSRYQIGPPTISDSDSHDVAPLYLSIDRSSHLTLTSHTHTHTLSLPPHIVICYLLIHPHVAMDTTDRLASS